MDVAAANSSSSQTQYPPVNQNQLPQWTRVGHLDKTRYPKTFNKDSLNPNYLRGSDDSNEDNMAEFSEDQNPAIRVQYLERSIAFLKAQHKEVLTSLHAEIEKLRSQNKELHFKLVMSQKELGQLEHREVDRDDFLDSYIQEKQEQITEDSSLLNESNPYKDDQVIELKHQIRDLKSKNNYLTQLVDSLQSRKLSADKRLSQSGKARRPARLSSASSDISYDLDRLSLAPARGVVVYDRRSGRRKPNEDEMQKICSHLHNVNEHQEHELAKLKSDLKEVLYSKKWTPDAYLLARAYVTKDGAPEETNILPALRSTTRKLPDIAYISRDQVTLPALKNTVGTKAMERRKRTQILQRARLHKEIS